MNQNVQTASLPEQLKPYIDRLLDNKKALFAIAGFIGGLLSGSAAAFSGILQDRFSSWVITGAFDAALISVAMVVAQGYYVTRKPPTLAALKPILIFGLGVGAAGGLVALMFVGIMDGGIFARLIGWGISGVATGLAVSKRVPNLAPKQAAMAGAIGAIVGCIVADYGPGYVVGVAISGAAIGLAVAVAEQILRKHWIEVAEYSDTLPEGGLGLAKQVNTYTLTLGEMPLTIGYSPDMDVRLKSRGLSLEKHHGNLVVEGDKCFFELVQTGARQEVAQDTTLRLGNCDLTARS